MVISSSSIVFGLIRVSCLPKFKLWSKH
jgi:hypothetical protein